MVNLKLWISKEDCTWGFSFGSRSRSWGNSFSSQRESSVAGNSFPQESLTEQCLMLKLEGHVLYGRYIDTSYAYHCIHLSLQFPKHQANNVAQFTLSLSFFFSLWERHWFWKHFYGSRSHSVEVILHHLHVPLLKSLFMEKNAGHSIFRRYVPLCEESSLQRRKCSYERSVSSRKVGTSETTMQVSGKRAIINCI